MIANSNISVMRGASSHFIPGKLYLIDSGGGWWLYEKPHGLHGDRLALLGDKTCFLLLDFCYGNKYGRRDIDRLFSEFLWLQVLVEERSGWIMVKNDLTLYENRFKRLDVGEDS